jgi:hypothetical protein
LGYFPADQGLAPANHWRNSEWRPLNIPSAIETRPIISTRQQHSLATQTSAQTKPLAIDHRRYRVASGLLIGLLFN